MTTPIRVRRHKVATKLFAVLLATGCGQTGTLTPPPAKIEEKPAVTRPIDNSKVADVNLLLVNSNELEQAIKANKDKVVVVDFWASFCAPCKKEFPHLVELHQKLGKEGVACISVSIDEDSDRDAALAFLRKQGATFANYLLTDDPEVASERWKIKSIPAVFVYDREGKMVKKFDTDNPNTEFSYAVVTSLVEELLKK